MRRRKKILKGSIRGWLQTSPFWSNQRHCVASFSALTLLYNFFIYHLHHHHLHHYYHRCHHHLYWCCYHHRPLSTLQYWNKTVFTQNKTRWSPLTPFDRARCLTKRVYESFSDVGEIRVWWRTDFQSGYRVLKKVFWTFSYLYLWHTM